jgi:membrane-bound lytic murein transglycosylase C
MMQAQQFFKHFIFAVLLLVFSSVAAVAGVWVWKTQPTAPELQPAKSVKPSPTPSSHTFKMVFSGQDRTPDSSFYSDIEKNAKTPSPAPVHRVESQSNRYAKPNPENYAQRVNWVQLEDEWVLEFPQNLASKQNIMRALSRLLLSERPVSSDSLLKKTSLSYKQLPFAFGKVLNQQGKPMRYPAQVYQFADYLLEHHTENLQDDSGRYVAIHIPLAKKQTLAPVKKYDAWVKRYAKKFSVDPALVFAIMETESGFDPKAVSRSNALGLMQLKAHTAGLDVATHIDLNSEVPDQKVLFDSQQNIRMGVAYLGLLQNQYLNAVRNKTSRKILAIASYNGGLSTVLKLFGTDKAQAIKRLNRLHPKQIYRKLRQYHPSAETRAYLDKVLRAERKYEELIV